jgi:Arylsulfotransferase (ASST)
MRTYRALLAAAALLVCLISSTSSASAAEGVTEFQSAPKLKPPALTVNRSSRGQAPGYIFTAIFQNKFFTDPLVGQGGPMILDSKGRYVWLRPASPTAPDTLNLQVQRYQGKPVLSWWDGTVKNTGEMFGGWHVANDRYRVIANVGSANGWDPSGHEFFITKNGTALVTGYKYLPNRNLTSMGGGESQTLLDSGVLEYDIKTGKLLHEWSADQHIPMEQSYAMTSPQNPNAYDPWHINSIDVDADGNWLVSMRNTWAIYKIDSKTGQILWTLGGKASTFSVPDNLAFAFQHDARWRANGQISIFDNDCCAFIPQPSGPPKPAPPVHGTQSRGLVMKLDETNKTVSLAMERKLYDLASGTQGNMQLLSNGNAFMGWGQQPFLSEYSKTGKLLLSVRYPDPDESYRAYRYAWKGNPPGRPSIAAAPTGSRTRVYVSWNGATEVASYRVFAGPTSRKLKVVAKGAKRQGFETSVTVRSAGPIVKVQALDAKGHVLGTSRAVRRQNTTGNTPAPTY